jgi:ribosome-associated protein
MLAAGVAGVGPANQRRFNIDNGFQTMTVPANHSDENVPAAVRIVEISREPVELYKILKFEGMVASGGQAKVVVAAGQVLVNGKIETRKRKKIVAGDTIEFNKEKISIKLASTVANEVSPPKTKAKPVAKKQVMEATSGNSVAIDVEKESERK